MSMTREERNAKSYIQKLLKSNGYKTYAKILDNFDVNLTDDPSVVAYMLPGQGVIVINRGLDASQASVITRHEILHEYLKHEKRLLDHLAKRNGIDRESLLDDTALKDLNKKLKRELYSSDLFNRAADYEISNRGYTEKDKAAVRAINLNGRILSGLVTEDDYPGWEELSVEEMYDKLDEIRKEEAAKPIQGFYMDDTTFIDPMTGVVYGVGEFELGGR